MPKLLLILLVALGGAAIWRRKEIRSDAERASQALAGAADTATSRIRPNATDDAPAHDDAGSSGDTDEGAEAAAADEAAGTDDTDVDDGAETATPAG